MALHLTDTLFNVTFSDNSIRNGNNVIIFIKMPKGDNDHKAI